MSYTSKVKEEILCNTDITSEEKKVELSAMFSVKNAFQKTNITLGIENLSIAKRVYNFLKDLTTMHIGIKYSTSKKLGIHKIFTITIEYQPGFKDFYDSLQIDLNNITKHKTILDSYIRGIFLISGYLKDPTNEYSLDFFMDDAIIANKLQDILTKLKKKSFRTKKRTKELVYLRNSEDIMDILVMCNAMQSFFSYEEVTMIKDLKNKTIREMNWEVANETKTINTGLAQIKMINYIGKKIGINNLSPVLEEVAFTRLKNPESSLQEIAEIIGISKSGIRNRFRRIEEIYNELLFENEEDGETLS